MPQSTGHFTHLQTAPARRHALSVRRQSIRARKKKAREHFKACIWQTARPKQDIRAGQKLSRLLSHIDIWEKGMTVASYKPLPGELSPEAFQKKQGKKLRFVFPRIKNGSMSFAPARLSKKTDWEQAPYGRGLQPSARAGKPVPARKIEVFLIPALAFDRTGVRLGRGGGFYDKILTQTPGLKIGLAHACQISDQPLPKEKHDQAMDLMATDCFLLVPAPVLVRKSSFIGAHPLKNKFHKGKIK